MKKEHITGSEFDFLIGKSIIKVENNMLFCDDNTIIKIEENEGCGGCGNGWSYIDLECLENNHNVITNVITEYEDEDRFKIFIYYQDNTINEITGSDGYGNGYYGGGFYITIDKVDKE